MKFNYLRREPVPDGISPDAVTEPDNPNAMPPIKDWRRLNAPGNRVVLSAGGISPSNDNNFRSSSIILILHCSYSPLSSL